MPDLRGQTTDIRLGGDIGIPSEKGGLNWTVRVVSDRGTHWADIARIIWALQGQLDLAA